MNFGKGDAVFSLNVGNAARRCKQILTEMTVTKVGRKYFYAIEKGREEYGHLENKYHIDGLRQAGTCSETSKLYLSRKEYSDEKEGKNIIDKLHNIFGRSYGRVDIDLDTLRKINRVLIEYSAKQ